MLKYGVIVSCKLHRGFIITRFAMFAHKVPLRPTSTFNRNGITDFSKRVCNPGFFLKSLFLPPKAFCEQTGSGSCF